MIDQKHVFRPMAHLVFFLCTPEAFPKRITFLKWLLKALLSEKWSKTRWHYRESNSGPLEYKTVTPANMPRRNPTLLVFFLCIVFDTVLVLTLIMIFYNANFKTVHKTHQTFISVLIIDSLLLSN